MPRAGNGYHRDDLRAELLQAAREWVREHGHLGLSMRTLAKRVGVSHGAPSHHFADRRALLLALATEGFEELIGTARSIGQGGGEPGQRLAAMGRAFIAFAEANPRLLELMYESELTQPALDPALRAYQQAGYEALRQEVERALPGEPPADIDIRVMTMWTAIYGFAALRKKHMLDMFEPASMQPAAVATALVERAVKAALSA